MGERIYLNHYMFWGLRDIPEGMWTNLAGPWWHEYFMDIIELGDRVAYALEDEAIGIGALFDLGYREWVARQETE